MNENFNDSQQKLVEVMKTFKEIYGKLSVSDAWRLDAAGYEFGRLMMLCGHNMTFEAATKVHLN